MRTAVEPRALVRGTEAASHSAGGRPFRPGPRASIQPGCASIEVRRVGAHSAITSLFAASPMKLLTPVARGCSVWAYTSSLGGGFVAGDQTRLDITLGASARCFIGTQSSTKIYRNPLRQPCTHTTTCRADRDSVLIFAPDFVQAFAHSGYTQAQAFFLEHDSSLILIDWFTSGRPARGERWAFRHFAARTEVWRTPPRPTLDTQRHNGDIDTAAAPSERVFFDSLVLDPDDGPLAAPCRAGRFNCFALLLLLGPAAHAAAAAALESVAHQPVARQASLLCSASPLADGGVLRIAGESVEAVGRELNHHLDSFRPLFGGAPWARNG